MTSSSPRPARLLTCAAAALSAASFANAQESLFLPLSSEPSGAFDCVDPFIGALRTELLEARPGLELSLSLPGVGEQRLRFSGVEEAWGGGSIWSARVEGDPNGRATLSRVGELVVGTVRVHERLFSIESAANGLHRLRELNENVFPTCGVTAQHEVSSEGGAPEQAAALTTGGAPPTIDVLVVYTTSAKNVEGGVAAIEAKVNLAIAETNQAYSNSQVVQRLRLVHQAELVGYVEDSSFSTMLGQLRSSSDGVIDGIHALRAQYGADMVAMIVAGSEYCGIAYLMQTVNTSFEANAFSVTSRLCATGYYTFGHELGHNMGCHHDRANASTGAYPYSYGYRTANGLWRTVMAYAPGTRVQYFSNPNISYSGQTLGIADPSPNSAENWRSLNNTAGVVAQFRCAVPAPYGSGKLSSIASTPTITYSGSPSISGAGLQIRITQGVPLRTAIAFYGLTQGSAPWNGGTLYVAGPKIRLGVEQLDATGAASFNFPVANCSPGDFVFCQGWFRDPAASDGTTVGLTNGLRVDFCP